MNRTTFITAASVGGVVIAGAAVIGANFGILNAADASTPLGDLSVASTAPAYAEASVTQTDNTSVYQVAQAGTVEVINTGAGLAFGEVVPAPGWTWTPNSEGSAASGVFSSETESLQFVAALSGDTIGAAVASVDSEGIVSESSPIAASSGSSADTSSAATTPTTSSSPSDDVVETTSASPAAEPTTTQAPAAQPAVDTTNPAAYDDDYDDDHYEDHEDHEDEDDEHEEEHDEDEDHEHEGRDDDD